MQAVVEVPALDNEPAPPWPVAQIAPWSWLLLNADCTDEELGLFVVALAARIEVLPPSGRDEVVDALLAEEPLIIADGLRVGDLSTGRVVVPGCCAGLEDWRDPWVSGLGETSGSEQVALPGRGWILLR